MILEELHDVASRPKVIAKLHLSPDRTQEFIEVVEVTATVLVGFPEPFVYQRDPDDAHYVNLAVAANTKLIVSRDKGSIVDRPQDELVVAEAPGKSIVAWTAWRRRGRLAAFH